MKAKAAQARLHRRRIPLRSPTCLAEFPSGFRRRLPHTLRFIMSSPRARRPAWPPTARWRGGIAARLVRREVGRFRGAMRCAGRAGATSEFRNVSTRDRSRSDIDRNLDAERSPWPRWSTPPPRGSGPARRGDTGPSRGTPTAAASAIPG